MAFMRTGPATTVVRVTTVARTGAVEVIPETLQETA
jgi:hypothetical protein